MATSSYNTVRDKNSKLNSSINSHVAKASPSLTLHSKLGKGDRKYTRKKASNYNTVKPSEMASNTARIPLEPTITKPSITPKSWMMKTKGGTPSSRAGNYSSFAKTRTKNTEKNYSSMAQPASTTSNRDKKHMTVYRGPFAINCTTTKDPTLVEQEISRALDDQHISFTRVSHS